MSRVCRYVPGTNRRGGSVQKFDCSTRGRLKILSGIRVSYAFCVTRISAVLNHSARRFPQAAAKRIAPSPTPARRLLRAALNIRRRLVLSHTSRNSRNIGPPRDPQQTRPVSCFVFLDVRRVSSRLGAAAGGGLSSSRFALLPIDARAPLLLLCRPL